MLVVRRLDAVARSAVGSLRVGRRIPTNSVTEGTSEIQQLVIARAISGLRIE
jgi:hypothetical protein